MPRKITAIQLRELGACKDSVDRFVALFGEEVTVTIKLCVEHRDAFDWDWAEENLLNYKAKKEFGAIESEARDIFDSSCQSAWGECVKGKSWESYHKVQEKEYAKYNKIRVTAFARAYKKM